MTEPALAGLLAKGKPIPLEGVTIDAEIHGFCSRVTVTQRYRNQEKTPIEAIYVFPLDERAAVCGFAALVDGAEIVGEVKEREEAFERYDDALMEGHGAYLLDQERPDVFTARIGNLLPGKEALVRITYVAEMAAFGFAEFSTAAPAAVRAPRPLDRIVVLQRADGSWDLDDELAAVLGIRLRKLRKKLEGATGDADEAARAWATALALAWLESSASESRVEWELLAGKAKAWLSQCGARLQGGEDWMTAAAPALTTRRFWH